MTSFRRTASLGACLAGALVGAPVAAQDAPLLLEIHAGPAVPLGAFSSGDREGEGAAPGASVSVAFAIPGDGRRTLYAGFSQLRFGCEDAGCGSGGRYVATGFDVGLRLALVTGRSLIPWVRFGAITTRVETDDLGGSNAGVSDLGFGGEAGLGVYVGSASAVALNPSITYSAVNTRLPGGSDLRMRYLKAYIGIVFAF